LSTGGPTHARAGTRLLVAALAGAAVLGVLVLLIPWQVAVLVGWDVTAIIVVGWVFVVVWPKTSDETAALATREDDSRAAADALIVAASVVSLAGVGLGLLKAARTHGSGEAVITAIAALSVVLAWATVHTVFLLHYARLFYAEGGGIDFGDCGAPDFRDFAYVAFTVGMTFQVSDTDITTKSIRHTVTRHALLSYLFGTVVVAMMINVVAGLLR
jgi:uncharacterized membrane protein